VRRAQFDEGLSEPSSLSDRKAVTAAPETDSNDRDRRRWGRHRLGGEAARDVAARLDFHCGANLEKDSRCSYVSMQAIRPKFGMDHPKLSGTPSPKPRGDDEFVQLEGRRKGCSAPAWEDFGSRVLNSGIELSGQDGAFVARQTEQELEETTGIRSICKI
jgi:hypothetical protein